MGHTLPGLDRRVNLRRLVSVVVPMSVVVRVICPNQKHKQRQG